MDDNERLRHLRDRATRLRIHAIRATASAGSGHPTSCCSAADLVAALFFDVMRIRPGEMPAPGDDRFVLSKGHAAPLLYAAWAETGAISEDDLLSLRRLSSDLEGHPTPHLKGIDVATGSLGQGLSYGAGMTLANRLDGTAGRVFVLLGDGECAEGSVWEAAELAAYHRLERLVAIVDINRLGQSGPTMLGDDVQAYRKRFESFGWRALPVDGHDMAAVVKTLRRAARPAGRPTAVLALTLKGKGIPDVEGKSDWHGKPLTQEAAKEAILSLERTLSGAELPPFRRPPAKARRSTDRAAPAAPPPPPYAVGDVVATREAYGNVLAELGRVNPVVVALDGDVKNSTYAERFAASCPERYVEAFIAEQNMVGMGVGLAAAGKIPFVSTFACFFTRAFDQIRMAAISRADLKLVGSHCGISVGTDGPSQMGLEDLAMLRAVPGTTILYPADAVATERLVALAAERAGIVYLRTSRPKTPVIYRPTDEFKIGGLAVVREHADDRITVVAAGITLHEALRAHAELERRGIHVRVLDLYSVKPVDGPALLAAAGATGNRLLTVEDHYAEGGLGDAVADAVSPHGVRVHKLAVREIPRSGPADELLDRYGIGERRIVDTVLDLIGR